MVNDKDLKEEEREFMMNALTTSAERLNEVIDDLNVILRIGKQLSEKKELVHFSKIVLTFKDNGLGVDLNKSGHNLFGLYKRFHTNKAEGKGMGLYMVKLQVEKLGGKISVKSTVNQGTEFTIELIP